MGQLFDYFKDIFWHGFNLNEFILLKQIIILDNQRLSVVICN